MSAIGVPEEKDIKRMGAERIFEVITRVFKNELSWVRDTKKCYDPISKINTRKISLGCCNTTENKSQESECDGNHHASL